MTASDFLVRLGTIDEALAVEARIPEFATITPRERYEQRLSGTPHLILVAESNEGLIGFKVGYELEPDVFYSWLGGVVPASRRGGVATQLRATQETWARDHGYTQLEVKSMNRYPAMLIMLISAGYEIVDVQGPRENGKIRFSLLLVL